MVQARAPYVIRIFPRYVSTRTACREGLPLHVERLIGGFIASEQSLLIVSVRLSGACSAVIILSRPQIWQVQA